MFDPKTVHRRKRKAVLRIYDNSGLRDSLTDDQAKPLLEWAAEHVEKGVDRTEYMEENDAQSVIEDYVTTVSHVLRLVNGLTLSLHTYENEMEAEAVLQRLKESLASLGGKDEAITAVLDEIMSSKSGYTTDDNYNVLAKLVMLAPAHPPKPVAAVAEISEETEETDETAVTEETVAIEEVAIEEIEEEPAQQTETEEEKTETNPTDVEEM